VKALKWFTSLLTVDDTVLDEQFMLTPDGGSIGSETESSESPSSQEPSAPPSSSQDKGGHPSASSNDRQPSQDREESEIDAPLRPRKPISLNQWMEEAAKSKSTLTSDNLSAAQEELDGDMERTEAILKSVFHVPPSVDFVIRPFRVGTEHPWKGIIVFIDGMADRTVINNNILEPLMLITEFIDDAPERRMESIVRKLIPGNQVETKAGWMDIINGIVTGSTAVFIEGCKEAVIVETKGWEHRSVGQPTTEQVVRGSHDAFTENFRTNTGLIRSRIRSENLITESLPVGKVAKTDVAVMYIAGLTNSKLVAEVKKRISLIDVDYLENSGALEQFLEDNPKSMIPQILATERPDRVTNMLMEGHVAVLVGQSPFALVLPTVLWSLVHTPEDASMKAFVATFLRAIRWLALVIALLLPSMYVALTNYHSEMLPTDLMLSIAGSRELVPFPVIMEVLFMEFSLELIREAGIRIPSVIGPTIGIVGALIIGQAAVQAGLVSPVLVIVIAVTALASFVVPNYSLNTTVRVMRFAFLLASALFGFYGIALLWAVMTVRLAAQKSFGVPYLAPVTPPTSSATDVFLRLPAYTMNRRPSFLYTQKPERQNPVTRQWSPSTLKTAKKNQQSGRKNKQ